MQYKFYNNGTIVGVYNPNTQLTLYYNTSDNSLITNLPTLIEVPSIIQCVSNNCNIVSIGCPNGMLTNNSICMLTNTGFSMQVNN